MNSLAPVGFHFSLAGWQWKMDRTTNDERKSKHCTKCSLIKKKKFFGSTVNSTIFFPVGCQNDLNFLWAVLVCSSINCRNKPQPYEKYQPKRQPATKKAMWQDAKSRKNACAKKSNTKKINQRKKKSNTKWQEFQDSSLREKTTNCPVHQ